MFIIPIVNHNQNVARVLSTQHTTSTADAVMFFVLAITSFIGTVFVLWLMIDFMIDEWKEKRQKG